MASSVLFTGLTTTPRRYFHCSRGILDHTYQWPTNAEKKRALRSTHLPRTWPSPRGSNPFVTRYRCHGTGLNLVFNGSLTGRRVTCGLRRCVRF